MQVSIETTQGLERRMTVQLPSDRIQAEVDSKLRTLAPNVRLNGFRPGKVPMNVVKSKFGHKVMGDVINEMVQSSFQEAVQQENLEIASEPRFEVLGEIKEGENLDYAVTFEVYPQLNVASFDDLKITRPVAEVGDSDLEEMIDTLRRQQRDWKAVDQSAEDGNMVVIDFDGTIDGVSFEGGSAKNFSIILGSNQFIPGFEEGLVGVSKDESRSLDVTFPADYGNPELAGKDAVFAVQVSEVREEVLPELNEDFFTLFGVTGSDVDAFRESVRNNMQRELENGINMKVKEQVMDYLVDTNQDADLPANLVAEEIKRLREQSLQDAPESMRNNLAANLTDDTLRPQAERRVLLGIVIGDIIKANDIQLDYERVRTTLEKMAESYDDPEEFINWHYANREEMSGIEAIVLEEQLVDWLLEQGQITDEASDFSSIMMSKASEAAS